MTLDEETFSIHLFSRKVNETILSFEPVIPNSKPRFLMTDTQTQSTWDAYSGTAIDGPLKGKQLTQEIGTIAYTQNWSALYARSVELPIQDHQQK